VTDAEWAEIGAELARCELPPDALDRSQIEHFAGEIAAGRLDADTNRLHKPPEPATPGDVERAEDLDEPARRERIERGREAFERGQVALCVLNGGMATRFGGVVKGIVTAFVGKSFLEIKCAQARRAAAHTTLVMNSFATHRATLAFIRERGLEASTRCFMQSLSVRLTPQGEIFRDADGCPSLYAPGHGDFPFALRESGLLAELESAGVRYVLLSNVDNLGADPDPLVIGHHVCSGRALTCEVAEARPGDVGGTPAFVDGRLEIVEGFRFPRDFDFEALHFLNTNTFTLTLEALHGDFALDWYYVEKRVDGRPAVQMERVVNELARTLDSGFLATPRDGPDGRFFPVKSRDELAAMRADPALVRRFSV
jgi:UTP--glucose-1-phosphate uridylyltransferase